MAGTVHEVALLVFGIDGKQRERRHVLTAVRQELPQEPAQGEIGAEDRAHVARGVRMCQDLIGTAKRKVGEERDKGIGAQGDGPVLIGQKTPHRAREFALSGGIGAAQGRHEDGVEGCVRLVRKTQGGVAPARARPPPQRRPVHACRSAVRHP